MRLEQKSYKWVKNWTAFYMIVMFVVFPLYYQNNYINMLEAKTSLFVLATCIYLAGGVIWMLLERLSGLGAEDNNTAGRAKKKKTDVDVTDGWRKRLMIQDVFLAGFAVVVVIATLTSGDIQNAWAAPECKMFGTEIILLCCGIYIIASRGYKGGKAVKAAFAAGMLSVFVLAVLNRYGIDPLDMYSNLVEHQKDIYLSTIGNVNILSNFICIFIPVSMGLYIYAEGKAEKAVHGILVYAGVMAGMATNSDSFFLGTAAGLIFLLWFAMDSNESFRSYISMLAICCISILSLRLFNGISSYPYEWKNLQQDIINDIPWIIITAVLIAAWIVIKKKADMIPLKKIRNVIFVLMGIGLIAAVIQIIRINIGAVDVQSRYLTFNDEWGTNRGFVWSRTCQLFGELPFYQQTVGIGPGEFRDFFASFNLERVANGLPDFADPHNEFLYYMTATGYIGAICYFGMIISSIVKSVRIKSRNLIVIAAVLVSWLAQGMVNNPLVFVTPYLFLFLGMGRWEMTREKEAYRTKRVGENRYNR